MSRCVCLRRYVIFVRDQQQAARLQQHSGSNVESALDLVGYVEFQHSYRWAPLLLATHFTCLLLLLGILTSFRAIQQLLCVFVS